MACQYLHAVQQNAIHNFYAKQFVQFVHEDHTFTVDTGVTSPSLHRVNAMTFYEQVTPFIMLAKTFEENPSELFYLIMTKESDWVQVDLKTGEEITCEIESSDM